MEDVGKVNNCRGNMKKSYFLSSCVVQQVLRFSGNFFQVQIGNLELVIQGPEQSLRALNEAGKYCI